MGIRTGLKGNELPSGPGASMASKAAVALLAQEIQPRSLRALWALQQG